MEGPDDAYDLTLDDRKTGDPGRYLEVIVREAIGNKQGSNLLGQHRPNLVAANYLLSTEAQAALMLRAVSGAVDLGDNLDGFAMSGAGIDARLDRTDLALVVSRPDWRGLLELVTAPPRQPSQS